MFCPKCGKQINDGDVFCAYCRSRINTQSANPQSVQQVGFQCEQPVSFVPNSYQTGSAQQMTHSTPIKQRNPVAVFFTVFLTGCALIASFVMFIKPGYMLQKDDDDSSRSSQKHDSSVSAVDKDSSKADKKTKTVTKTEKPTETSESAATTSVSTTTETSAPTEEVTTAPVTEPPAESKADDNRQAKAEAENFSTDEKPSFEDFEWCYGQFGLVRDPPENCEFLTDPISWSGGWKCFIIYTTAENADPYIREINNVNIGVDGTALALKMKHYLYEVDGESYDDSVTSDFDFSGKVYQGMFDALGVGRVTMTSFWKKDGHEYAVGDYLLQSGENVYIAFMR